MCFQTRHSSALLELELSLPRRLLRRLIMLLHTWKVAESPTVGILLEWFHRVGVNRHDIKIKYAKWFGSKIQAKIRMIAAATVK